MEMWQIAVTAGIVLAGITWVVACYRWGAKHGKELGRFLIERL